MWPASVLGERFFPGRFSSLFNGVEDKARPLHLIFASGSPFSWRLFDYIFFFPRFPPARFLKEDDIPSPSGVVSPPSLVPFPADFCIAFFRHRNFQTVLLEHGA